MTEAHRLSDALPRRQKQLYNLLLGRGDVLIEDIYREMFEANPMRVRQQTLADKQRHLGPYITNMNRSLTQIGSGLKVEPGALKNTYRLVAASS